MGGTPVSSLKCRAKDENYSEFLKAIGGTAKEKM